MRQRLTQYTRYLTIALAVLQGNNDSHPLARTPGRLFQAAMGTHFPTSRFRLILLSMIIALTRYGPHHVVR